MIQSIGQIMLYVNNQEDSANFWKNKVGFEKIEKVIAPDGDFVYIVAPTKQSDVEFVLHNRQKIEKSNPELSLGTPSVLMKSNDLQETYNTFIQKGIQAHPMMTIGDVTFFNFADNEGNYFAVQEIK